MGVTETLRILLTIFLSTACIQKVRLFGVYDVRLPFLAEIYTAPLKSFVPSSVLQAIRALRNALAALAKFLAGVAPVSMTAGYELSHPCPPSWRVVQASWVRVVLILFALDPSPHSILTKLAGYELSRPVRIQGVLPKCAA